MTISPNYETETFKQSIERTVGGPVQIYGCPNSGTYGVRQPLPSGCEQHWHLDTAGLEHARRDYWPENTFSPATENLGSDFELLCGAPE